MPTKIRQGKYIDKDGIETDVVFLGAEKAIFDDNNVRLDNKLISMSKASGLTAEDTEGMLGTAEENVNFQLLIDAIAEKVMNELVTNSALTSQLANYVTKAMMSNSQTNDQNKVPTSALAYLMNQQITENENAITQLNGDIITLGSKLQSGRVSVQRVSGEVVSQRVNFPEKFNSIPKIVVTAETGDPRGGMSSIRDVDLTGFTVYIYSNVDDGVSVSWIATN